MENLTMPKLIKDLGTVKERGHARYGLFECPICKKNYKTQIRLVNSLQSTKCKSCSVKLTKNATKHGDNGTKLHKLWINFRRRCDDTNNPRYKDWGGRGITYYKQWQDYLTFKKWALENNYKDGLELDRINNDGNYEPNNCRFVDKFIQASNKRKRKDNTIGYIGIYKTRYNKFFYEVTSRGKTYREMGFEFIMDAVKARDKFIKDNNLPHTLNL